MCTTTCVYITHTFLTRNFALFNVSESPNGAFGGIIVLSECFAFVHGRGDVVSLAGRQHRGYQGGQDPRENLAIWDPWVKKVSQLLLAEQHTPHGIELYMAKCATLQIRYFISHSIYLWCYFQGKWLQQKTFQLSLSKHILYPSILSSATLAHGDHCQRMFGHSAQ